MTRETRKQCRRYDGIPRRANTVWLGMMVYFVGRSWFVWKRTSKGHLVVSPAASLVWGRSQDFGKFIS
jgi:hypothetical protein